MKRLYFLTISLVLTSVIWSKDHSTIQFKGLELLDDQQFSAANHYAFELNGVKLSPDSSKYQIPLNEGFDTLFQILKDGSKVPYITKMRNNERYFIQINPCSFFELIPENNAAVGIVTFYFGENRDRLVGYCGHMSTVEFDSLAPSLSGMCMFSPKEIEVKSAALKHNSNAVLKLRYLFLHNEIINIHLESIDLAPFISISGYLAPDQSAEDFDRY